MNQENINREDKYVNLRDMFFYILKKWKLLCMLFLIGALVGSAVSFIKMSNSSLESQKKIVDALVQSQTAFEKVDLEKVRQYKEAVDDYNSAVNAEQSSNRLKIESKVWVATHTYFLTTTQKNINLVNAYISGILNKTEDVQMLYENSGSEWTYDEFATTISISFKEYEAPVAATDELASRNATVTVRAWDEKQENAVSLLNQLNDLYMQTISEIEDIFPENFSNKFLRDSLKYSTVSTLTSLRESLKEKRISAYNTMSKLSSNLGENEVLYYNVYYNENYNPKSGFSKKWPVAAAIGFVLAGAIAFGIIYLMNPSIKNENEISLIYGYNVLAIMARIRKKVKGPDALIQRWENKGKAPVNNKDYLRTALQTLDIRRGVASGDVNDPTISRLAANIAESDLRFIEAGSLAVDPEAQIKVKNADGVVFIVRLWYTKSYDFERDIEVARNLDTAVLGVIVIR